MEKSKTHRKDAKHSAKASGPKNDSLAQNAQKSKKGGNKKDSQPWKNMPQLSGQSAEKTLQDL